jgi:hypothetical protein
LVSKRARFWRAEPKTRKCVEKKPRSVNLYRPLGKYVTTHYSKVRDTRESGKCKRVVENGGKGVEGDQKFFTQKKYGYIRYRLELLL